MHPGKRLRLLREQLGLTVRDVEAASGRLAAKRGNSAHAIPLSRLSDIENKGVVPSIYRIYSLAVTYRRDIREILDWYGMNLDEMAEDLAVATLPNTHCIETLKATGNVKIPVLHDSAFDPARTQNLGRIIQQWGAVPFALPFPVRKCPLHLRLHRHRGSDNVPAPASRFVHSDR